ncbi:ABC transporter permease subunit [Paraburkholderia kirstenboschensis]|uniref:ABC transporter permease subunit n=1 Tax=Paraburkholderia kirstenboschensis TaxID=1245436 RepID=A0ABZ0EAR8_9BURK|nr:ABC transporter permease subunit [Paraburkholderia kirstenboschensis]WOD13611.1 ABC transporter permease subunit [Paraburkholderia kirstenboschensis]
MIPDIALVVPFFLFVRQLGLLDRVGALIVTYVAIMVPFSVFMWPGYFESLPDELDKAARVDGYSRIQVLLKVFLPLAVPSLVAVIMFTVLTSRNEFLFASMCSRPPRRRPSRSSSRRSRRIHVDFRSSTQPAWSRSCRL